MERRFFLRNALLGIVGMSAAEVRATLPRDGWKRDVDFEPYPIDLTIIYVRHTSREICLRSIGGQKCCTYPQG